jgi:uncharacterized BrkB/YihY/UPF0761 family membrane protein
MKRKRQAMLPAGLSNWQGRLRQTIHRMWLVLGFAGKRFSSIDGPQLAGAFAFNAFFSLFPLMILLVTVVSTFVDRDIAGKEVIASMQGYVPISGEMQQYISSAIAGVINARDKASTVASLALAWTALQCFATLIVATNRAWGSTVLQLVAFAAEKPDVARQHDGCNPSGHGRVGAAQNSERLAVSPVVPFLGL